MGTLTDLCKYYPQYHSLCKKIVRLFFFLHRPSSPCSSRHSSLRPCATGRVSHLPHASRAAGRTLSPPLCSSRHRSRHLSSPHSLRQRWGCRAAVKPSDSRQQSAFGCSCHHWEPRVVEPQLRHLSSPQTTLSPRRSRQRLASNPSHPL
jgi:hypothetical protein